VKYLNNYNSFKSSEDDTLYIFDFDDTLVDTPSFIDLVIDLIKEDNTLKNLLDKSLSFVDKTIDDLKIENGRLYVEDPNELLPVKGNWVRKKNKHLYLITPNEFHFSDISLPKKTLVLANLYREVKNKAIVTGRPVKIKDKILNTLNELNLEKPNFGLFCYPLGNDSSNRVAIWKGKTIVDLIKSTNFTKVKFYDDKSKWVNKVKEIVNRELPDIDFEGIKVNS
jgi:hypothetical protein